MRIWDMLFWDMHFWDMQFWDMRVWDMHFWDMHFWDRNLMCVGPTGWSPETLVAVRHAAAVEPPPRCVACGQAVSRRLRKTSKRGGCLSDDDCLDVCPVCDCRLTPDDDLDVFINAC